MKKGVGLVFILGVVAWALWGYSVVWAQSYERYFEETGHWVSGEFYTHYYNSTSVPLEAYGQPITEAFQDERTGRLVQYFQKARFELHPEAPPEQRVQMTPLGEYLYEKAAGQAIPQPESWDCQSFPPHGILVCHDFLKKYRELGGVAVLGYPISPVVIEDGIIIQYFRNGRLEWRPELPPNQRVRVGDLGVEYFYLVGEDPSRLLPVKLGRGLDLREVRALRARAYPILAVTPRSAEQTVFIYVQDQRAVPLEGAEVSLVIRFPDGSELRRIVPQFTNAQGITSYTFAIRSAQIGLATVEVSVSFGGVVTKTVTSFRIWW